MNETDKVTMQLVLLFEILSTWLRHYLGLRGLSKSQSDLLIFQSAHLLHIRFIVILHEFESQTILAVAWLDAVRRETLLLCKG